MGYCVRCGELSTGTKCLKCRGRSVVSIATALDSIGRSDSVSLEDAWGSRFKGPFPKISSSTPIGAITSKPKSPIVDRRPFPRPMTSRQGAHDSDKDQSSDKDPSPPLASASNIQTARTGLSKGSTRNSSFFFHAAEKSTSAVRANDNDSSARKILGSYSTATKPRPRINSQLFFHETASSAVSSPVTPNSPTAIRWPSQQGSDTQAQVSHKPSTKKNRICCKCNEPLRRGGKGSPRRIGVPPAAGTPDDYAWYHYECLTCPVCNGHFTEQDYFVRHGTDVYHPKCQALKKRAENETECTRCTKKVTLGSKGDGFQHEAKSYHFECAFICYTCQTLTASSEPHKESHGKIYCKKCTPNISPPVSKPTRRRCVSSGSIALTASSDDITSPSDLLRNRKTALPKLGGPTICPRCNQSISVTDETRGPFSTRWHKKCIVCAGPTCKKIMDSDARVYKNESGQWLVYCRNCTDKNRRKSSYMQ